MEAEASSSSVCDREDGMKTDRSQFNIRTCTLVTLNIELLTDAPRLAVLGGGCEIGSS